MNEQLRIRAGTSADADFVDDLARRTVMQSVAAFRNPSEVQVRVALARLLQIVDDQSHVTLVAEWDGRPVGFLLMLDDLPDEVTTTPQAFVAYMAVEPNRRREGIGRALLAAAEDEARKRSLPYIALMVTEDNTAARDLYERGGYVTERRLMCKPL